MTLVFGILLLKNLTPDLRDSHVSNCDEFGHIHFSVGHIENKNSVATLSSKSQASQDGDDGCHEAKSVFSYSLFPATYTEIEAPFFEMIFENVLALENHFQSPFLEPLRRPPKLNS